MMDKKKMVIATLMVLVITVLVYRKEEKETFLIEGNQLPRQEAGKGAYDVELILDMEDETATEIVITVPEQCLMGEEEEILLQGAIAEIEKEFIGDNVSLDEVKTRVVIREQYQQGLVQASWEFSNYGLIAADGSIREEHLLADKEIVQAKVHLVCQDSKLIYEFCFEVCRREKNQKELFYENLGQVISENGKKEGESILLLPEELDGHKLVWKKAKSKGAVAVFFGGMLVVMLLPELEKEKEKEKRKRREEQLLLEYPALVSKLSLLLGAGMTLRSAWKQITKKQTTYSVVYEEMLITQREIENGKSELEAYVDFGERCGLQKYRKLMNYLVQNIRKGNKGVCQWLETEVEEAFAERRNMAQKLGEEVGTKLLLPMMLMLGIVILVIMIPAVISFQSGIS